MLSLDLSQQGAEYVKRGARLLYSITRNIQKKELKEKILEALKPIQDPSEKPKLRKILLQLTNLIYQRRLELIKFFSYLILDVMKKFFTAIFLPSI